MTTGERIKELIHYKGLNVKTFAELCGYDRPQVFYDLIKGKTQNISAAMSTRILSHIPEVNRIWLLTGEGPMIGEAAPVDYVEHPTPMVPLLPISAIAGPLKAYFEDGVELRRCQQVGSPTPSAEIAIPVTGDSMEPTIPNGSIVYIRRINEEAFIPWGHALVIDTENGVFIKNILPDNANDHYLWAESLNPKYPRMHIPKDSINGIYRVLCVTKPFTTM